MQRDIGNASMLGIADLTLSIAKGKAQHANGLGVVDWISKWITALACMSTNTPNNKNEIRCDHFQINVCNTQVKIIRKADGIKPSI
jgi:hypothetical protein